MRLGYWVASGLARWLLLKYCVPLDDAVERFEGAQDGHI